MQKFRVLLFLILCFLSHSFALQAASKSCRYPYGVTNFSDLRGKLSPLESIPTSKVVEFEVPQYDESVHHRKFSDFVERVKELRSLINEKIDNRLNDIEFAVYPASGYDSAYPVALLQNVRVTMTLDRNDFVNPRHFNGNVRTIRRDNPNGRMGYVNGNGIVLEERFMAPKIVSNLKHSDPRIQIRNVYAFTVEGDSGIHGLIIYDRGPNTPKSAYLHVTRFFGAADVNPTESHLRSTWWYNLIPNSNVALLYKGATGISDENIREVLEKHLLQTQNGIFVVPTNEITVRYRRNGNLVPLVDAWSPDSREVRMPFFPAGSHERTTVRHTLGYDREITIVTFPN